MVQGCTGRLGFLTMDLFDSTPASRRKSRPGAGEDRVESVTQLTRRIKDLLESGVGAVWVEGEVSNHRRQASGRPISLRAF